MRQPSNDPLIATCQPTISAIFHHEDIGPVEVFFIILEQC